MKTDTLFYRLFQTEPSLALELAGLDVPGSNKYRFGSHEIKQTAFRLDGVLEPPPDQPDSPLVFVEVQFQPDEAFYLRFFGEIILYLRQYNPVQPWLALVFYPYAQIERTIKAALPFIGLPSLRCVYLNELHLVESANPKLWLIELLIVEESQLATIVEKVKAHRANNPSDGIDWMELLETLLIYKLPTIPREEIQTMFGLRDIDLKQTRFYRDTFNEGQLEGVKKGRAEGEAALLLRILDRRFGPLSKAVKEQIAATDAETLLIYGERVLDAKSLEDVFGVTGSLLD